MGQINPDISFGKKLIEIASSPEYKTFLEVGAWNGQGSTRCLLLGILQHNPSAKLYSLEANKEMFEKAQQFYSPCPPQLTLIHGSLHHKCMALEDIHRHPKFYKFLEAGNAYYKWIYEEQTSVYASPIYSIPHETLDVVLIDGGEFSAQGDWEILKAKQPKLVCLDDTQVMKTHHIYNELKSSPQWDTLADFPEERNGWAVFGRKT
jgi:hypothetical protein